MIRVLCIRAIVLALFLVGAVAIGRAQDLAITRATVYAAPDAPARRDVTIVIRHGVIAGVGEHLRIPKGIETIPCQGCVVLAGFWNAHVLKLGATQFGGSKFHIHSHRKETIGSTAAARRAGSHAESTVTAAIPAVAAMKIIGSKGFIL